MNKNVDLGKLHMMHRVFNAMLYATMALMAFASDTYLQSAGIIAVAMLGTCTCIIGKVFYFDHARKVHMSNWFVGDPTVPKNFEEPALKAAIRASKLFRTLIPLTLFIGAAAMYMCDSEEVAAYMMLATIQMFVGVSLVPYLLYSRDPSVNRLTELSNEVTLTYV